MSQHRDYAGEALSYAEEVLAGDIPACLQIKQACRRFLDDVRGDTWVWNTAKVARACLFIEQLPHTEGALSGQTIRLEPWQTWIVAALFGLVDQSGLRKHHEAFLLIPRKNGKSTLAAGIALYMTVADREAGAQVYIGANSEKQANFCFKPARLMADRAKGGFKSVFGVEVNAASIVTRDGSFLQRQIGKPGDGSNPHCAILDEYHEAATSEAYDTMKTGVATRRQPLLIAITTAGTNTAGPCRAQQLYAEQVLSGATRDDRLFAAVYTIDKEDDWKDFSCWRKANPNCGVSFTEERLRELHQEAINRPDKKVDRCTKHLNVWESAATAWLNMAHWDRCGTAPPFEEVKNRGYRAWLGVDLGTQIDITALGLLVELPGGERALYPFLFLPHSATLASKNASAYAQWAADGAIIANDGDALDFEAVFDVAKEFSSQFALQSIAFDAFQGQMLAQALARDLGIPTYRFPQTFTEMWGPMVEMEGLLAKGQLVHPRNPCLDWMAKNICAARQGERLRPTKPHGQDHLKIDGIVAGLMALGLSIADAPVPTTWEMFVLD